MKNVLDQEWLVKHLHEKDIRIIDCRFSLSEPNKGKEAYLISHLPGSIYFDLEKDLSKPASTHGGRHPLPDLDDFIQKLEKAGIDDHTTVVVYDHGEGAFASRFWWMLRYLGHDKVYVLNGGFKGWTEANNELTSEVPYFEKTNLTIQIQDKIVATIEDVKEAILDHQHSVVLIDSREEKRFLGIEEPIDKKAGHIPSAINKPWFDGLNSGLFKNGEEQQKRFKEINHSKQIIVYCGSGVTASPNFLALKEAGYENVRLYVGSFSDWISYDENEIN
jgi:thiosulfate/3-mercaptopyruvate sulfurtransferase